MKYNKAICDMLDKVVERLKKENEKIQLTSTNLEKYISGFILESMAQYKENSTFEENMTEKSVIDLYNFNEEQSLLMSMVFFAEDSSSNKEKDYPLALDYWVCYDIIIDFCEEGLVKCLNCGNIFYGELNVDDYGIFTQCRKCNATFDV